MMDAESDAGLDSLPQECHFLILEFLHDAKTFASLSTANWYLLTGSSSILSCGAGGFPSFFWNLLSYFSFFFLQVLA